jgi:hypothetical protein
MEITNRAGVQYPELLLYLISKFKIPAYRQAGTLAFDILGIDL